MRRRVVVALALFHLVMLLAMSTSIPLSRYLAVQQIAWQDELPVAPKSAESSDEWLYLLENHNNSGQTRSALGFLDEGAANAAVAEQSCRRRRFVRRPVSAVSYR